MKRTISLALVLFAIGCGSKQQPAPAPVAEQPAEDPAEPQVLEEAEDCAVEEETTLADQAHRDFAVGASGKMNDLRHQFRSVCSSSIAVKMNWGPVFRSIGFDEGESDAAITTAWESFLAPATPWCQSNFETFREKVKLVLLTPTDQSERVGMCLDEEGTLIYRYQLDEGGEGVTHWDAGQIESWLSENL